MRVIGTLEYSQAILDDLNRTYIRFERRFKIQEKMKFNLNIISNVLLGTMLFFLKVVVGFVSIIVVFLTVFFS